MRLRGQVLKSFHHLLPLDRNTSIVVAQACSSSEPRPISDFVFRALMRFVPFFTLFKILLEQAGLLRSLPGALGSSANILSATVLAFEKERNRHTFFTLLALIGRRVFHALGWYTGVFWKLFLSCDCCV